MIIAKKKDNNFTTEVTISENPNVRSIYSGLPESLDGIGTDFRPGQLVVAGYASCLSISIRKYLTKDNISFEDVIVSAKMDTSEAGKTKIYTKIEIIADISEEKKNEYIERSKSCPVCNLLTSEKEFLNFE